jgi:hypothetical protein
MNLRFFTLPLLLCLPILTSGQPDSAKSPNVAVNTGFLMGGGAAIGADVEYLFANNRWGVQAGGGLVGFGAGVSYHLKPRINSPFISLQYWHQVGSTENADILGAMYVYRYKKWLQAGVGLGTFLSENGEQKVGDVLPMFQAGIFVPFSPTSIVSSTLDLMQRQEAKKVHTGPRQAVYVEVLGRTQLYSVNYDRRFFRGRGGPGASVGFCYFDLFGVQTWAVPLSFYYLLGSGIHHIELGAGATALGSNRTFAMGTATIGYRYQPAIGLMLRAGLTPLYISRILSLGRWGISAGYAF